MDTPGSNPIVSACSVNRRRIRVVCTRFSMPTLYSSASTIVSVLTVFSMKNRRFCSCVWCWCVCWTRTRRGVQWISCWSLSDSSKLVSLFLRRRCAVLPFVASHERVMLLYVDQQYWPIILTLGLSLSSSSSIIIIVVIIRVFVVRLYYTMNAGAFRKSNGKTVKRKLAGISLNAKLN